MAEKPILFNTEMVRAILDGRKTQTRRIIKGLPLYEPYFEEDEGRGFLMDSEDGQFYALEVFSNIKPGDVLYVRETFCGYYLPSVERWPEGHMHYEYKASNPNGNKRPMGPEFDDDWEVRPWRPSIHMPKEAARLFLRVTGVRCERLQEITSGEAVAEGIQSNLRSPSEAADALIAFEALWNNTVRQDAMKRWGWNANPWVWVIEFERIDKPKGWCES